MLKLVLCHPAYTHLLCQIVEENLGNASQAEKVVEMLKLVKFETSVSRKRQNSKRG